MVLAIQDPTRKAILFLFYSHPRPHTVAEVATEAGVHRSVAYTHLEKLVGLGYLTSGQRRGRPGKPAKIYSLAPEPPAQEPPAHGLLTLLRVLAATTSRLGSRGLEAAEESARELGSILAHATAGSGSWWDPLLSLGDRLHLDPGGRLVVEHCAFKEACSAEPGVVPLIHAGLIEGVLAATGGRARVTSQACTSEGCVFGLAPFAAAGRDGRRR